MIIKIKLPFLLRALRKLNFPRKLGVLERLYGWALNRHGVTWVDCSNDIEWKLDLSDSCHRWIVYGNYEGGEGIELAKQFLQNGGVYVDSGANIGQWLLFLGHLPNIRALEFEPVRSERSWLEECVTLQDDWNVEIFDFGLSSKDTEVEIQLDGPRSTLNMDWYEGKNLARETVSLKRLDATLNELKVETVDFWKLDTEGAEKEALIGAEDYLATQKIRCIYFECNPANYSAIKKLLESFDYQIFELHKGKLTPKIDTEIAFTQDLVTMPNQ